MQAKVKAVDTPGDGSICVTVDYLNNGRVMATRDHHFSADHSNQEILDGLQQKGIEPVRAELERGEDLKRLVGKGVELEDDD